MIMMYTSLPSFKSAPKQIASRRRSVVIRAGIQPGADLVKEGKVRLVKQPEVKDVVAEGYKVLDTRPDYEYQRAKVKGAIHVPYFSADEAMDPLTLVRKGMHAGFGGIWNGAPLTKVNETFLEEVAEALGGQKNTQILVTCSQGLRSLVTIKDLHDDGYTQLAWLYGGLCMAGDALEADGDMTLAEANIGGVSKMIMGAMQNVRSADE